MIRLAAGGVLLREAQTLERGASRPSIDARHNDQFKNRNAGQLHPALAPIVDLIFNADLLYQFDVKTRR